MSEPLIQLLAHLPAAAPDPRRGERIKARCRKRLPRQAAGPSNSRAPAPRGSTAPLWQPFIAALGVAYLTEVVVQALRFYTRFLY